MADDIWSAFEPEREPERRVPAKPQRVMPANYQLQKLAKDYTADAFQVLLEIMNNSEEDSSTRLEAAKQVLDRGWGKATVKAEIDTKHTVTIHAALKELAATIQPPRLTAEDHNAVDALQVTVQEDA